MPLTSSKWKLIQKHEMFSRQKTEELELLNSIIEKREDFKSLTKFVEENRSLKNHINKLTVRASNYKRVIDEFKLKGQFKREGN